LKNITKQSVKNRFFNKRSSSLVEICSIDYYFQSSITKLKEQQQWQPLCCCSSNFEAIFSQKKKAEKMIAHRTVVRGEFFRVNNYFYLDFAKSKFCVRRSGSKEEED
jgi:hypothetical protein